MATSGVDTVSYAFRPKGNAALDALARTAHHSGAAGGVICDERGPDGGRVMGWQKCGLIAIETRLGALTARDEDDHRLAPVSDVVVGAAAAREVIRDVIGADPGDQVEVRRFDLASELAFAAEWEGLTLLASLGGMCPPRARVTQEIDAAGTVMTVYVRTPRRGVVLSRAYDKGRECGSHPAGQRIRIESQNRPAKAARMRPEVLAAADLSAIHGRTMRHYLTAENLIVAGPDGAVSELVRKVHRGEISCAKAERLAGSVAFLKHAGRGAYHDPDKSEKENNRTSARRLKALRDTGIALEHELPAEAVMPTSQLLRETIESFTA